MHWRSCCRASGPASSSSTTANGTPPQLGSASTPGRRHRLGLALLATIVALIKLRQRKELWVGSAALTVLLAIEAYIGGLIVDASKDTLTAVYIPLAMAIMALVVWLPLRARTGRTGVASPAS